MGEKIKITFLGTAGAIPTAKRGHTAILLKYRKENILVDCGEGTQRQFRLARLNPNKITRLLITHWHGDHTLGIPGLLQTLSFNNYKKTLFIYGPKGIRNHIKNVLRAFPSIMINDVNSNIKLKIIEVDQEGIFFEAEDFYLEAAKMTHGTPANAYSFVKKGQLRIDKKKLKKSKLPFGKHLQRLKQGQDIRYKGKKYLAKNLTFVEGRKKISFVMDTSVNNRIATFVKDSDLLVIESSYSHELVDLAREHKHLTVKQDAEIAKKAKVKKLILTHLSDRYEKNPEKILSEAKKIFRNSHLVKDFDVIEV